MCPVLAGRVRRNYTPLDDACPVIIHISSSVGSKRGIGEGHRYTSPHMSATTLATPKSPAFYARISKKEKQAGKEHLWVERQEGDGRALGETIGWPEPTLYVDDGHSAWSGARRPGYEQMVADIKAGKIDGILIGAAFDRLSRSAQRDAAGVQVPEGPQASVCGRRGRAIWT